MVNIALCGDSGFTQGDAAHALLSCARLHGLPEPALHAFGSPLDLLEHLDDPSADPLFDLLVLQAGQAGMSAIQAVRDARRAGYAGKVTLVGEAAACALDAQRLRVDAFLEAPVTEGALEREAHAILESLAALDAESIVLRVRGGARRVVFPRLVYAQTQNHDQVLHLRDGATMQLRCSSQDLFDRLAHDPRFLKLGSSYIVNLDMVSSLNANGGTLAFVEGSTVPVPVRLRKAVQDALHIRAERRKHV